MWKYIRIDFIINSNYGNRGLFQELIFVETPFIEAQFSHY